MYVEFLSLVEECEKESAEHGVMRDSLAWMFLRQKLQELERKEKSDACQPWFDVMNQ